MTEATPPPRPTLLPKTTAKELFCVTDKDIEGLCYVEKKNRHNKRMPMKLYDQDQVAALALGKFGGEAGLEEAREERRQKRQKRIETKQNAPATSPAAESVEGTPSTPGIAEAAPAELHPFIAERVENFRPGTIGSGEYVLYWMRTALRTHENPALDIARHEARRRGLPLLVCAFMLTETHPHPTLRRMKFFLEGVRDVQLELKAQGQSLLVFVEGHTPGFASPEDVPRDQGSGFASSEQRPGCEPSVKSARVCVPEDRPGVEPVDKAVRVHNPEEFDCTEDAGCSNPTAGYGQDVVSGQEMIRRAVGRGGRGTHSGWAAVMHTASRAALLITEEMPVEPEVLWSKRLAADLPPNVAFWGVDTACVVPMRLFQKPYEKAWAFRSAAEKLRGERLRSMPYRDDGRDWAAHFERLDALAEEAEPQEGPSPGWESLDLLNPSMDIEEVLRSCPGVDVSVPGVSHMIGGSRRAYCRWESFRRNGLDLYAARRNNAMNRNGVSRLSAYHRFGMLSPFKVARDSLLSRSNGANKFGDEFLTWREVAYTWCHHHLPTAQLFDDLPKWAQQTLKRHAHDPRVLKSREEIEAGTTGDLLWDAMQHQLVTTGELHNNARMTWGKAVLLWTPDPVSALNQLIHINNRFSLDGCDPASYGGVMWCFGLFDGPKAAESTPIYGSLRQRSTASIARRLNAAAFRALAIDVLDNDSSSRPKVEAGQRTLDSIFAAARKA